MVDEGSGNDGSADGPGVWVDVTKVSTTPKVASCFFVTTTIIIQDAMRFGHCIA